MKYGMEVTIGTVEIIIVDKFKTSVSIKMNFADNEFS